MKFRNLAAAAAAAALVTTPVVAQAATSVRTSAPAKDSNDLSGGSLVLAVLAVAAIIAGIVIAADGGSDTPVSP